MSLSNFSQAASANTLNSSLPDSSCRHRKCPKERLVGGSEPSTATPHKAPPQKAELKRASAFDETIVELRELENPKVKRIKSLIKIIFLLVIWAIFTIMLMVTHGDNHLDGMLSVLPAKPAIFKVERMPYDQLIGVTLSGPFKHQDIDLRQDYKQAPAGDESYKLRVVFKHYRYNDDHTVAIEEKDVSETWELILENPDDFASLTGIIREKVFTLTSKQEKSADSELVLYFTSTVTVRPVSFKINCDLRPIPQLEGTIYGALLLVLFLLLIGFNICHRTFAVMMVATMGVAILSAINARPSINSIITWIDEDFMLLLFGMTILMAIMMNTGVFDYLAVLSFSVFKGHIWPTINILLLITSLFATVIDNAAVMIIVTPICIRLCEVMNVHPVPVLNLMMIFANTVSSLTPMSEYPNLKIALVPYYEYKGITYMNFVLHMFPGILLISLQTYLQLRLVYRNIRKIQFLYSPEVTRMRRIMNTWNRTAMRILPTSKDEQTVRAAILEKMENMNKKLNALAVASKPPEDYQQTLSELMKKYRIRDKWLLVKAIIALIFVLIMFMLNSAPHLVTMSGGWVALMGAVLVLLLSDMEDMDSILARVQWCTMIFVAVFYVLSKIFIHLGFIDSICEATEKMILAVGPEYRNLVAILCILWVSGLAASVLHSTPLAEKMTIVTITVATNKELNLPWSSMVFALAFGTSVGCNGTIIGSPGNIVSSGIAEQHGYIVYFWQYLKVGFPIMIGNLIVASLYLVFAHVVCGWN